MQLTTHLGNPLSCDCEMTWLKNLIARETFHEISEATCQKPSEVSGMNLKNVPLSKLTCSKQNGFRLNQPSQECPILTESKRKPRPGRIISEGKPFFADSGDIYRSEDNNKNEKKSNLSFEI